MNFIKNFLSLPSKFIDMQLFLLKFFSLLKYHLFRSSFCNFLPTFNTTIPVTFNAPVFHSITFNRMVIIFKSITRIELSRFSQYCFMSLRTIPIKPTISTAIPITFSAPESYSSFLYFMSSLIRWLCYIAIIKLVRNFVRFKSVIVWTVKRRLT